jgi:nitrite reductase/ring-hydroxylating ferredoxin subunit
VKTCLWSLARPDVTQGLSIAAVYERQVGASIGRIWENVFDWQHLDALHDTSFAAVRLIDNDQSGWRIALTSQPGDAARAQVLKLYADRKNHAYRVVTEQGLGAGSEIRVQMTRQSDHQTKVVITYHIDEQDPARLAAIGKGFVGVYTRLWDEDEAMMVRRETLSARPKLDRSVTPLDLGPVQDLHLPQTVVMDGQPVRLALMDDQMTAFSAVCPHWLGPLDETEIEDGTVRCPWHNYRFDLRTHKSCDGRGLTLAPVPALTVKDGRAWLGWPHEALTA